MNPTFTGAVLRAASTPTASRALAGCPAGNGAPPASTLVASDATPTDRGGPTGEVEPAGADVPPVWAAPPTVPSSRLRRAWTVEPHAASTSGRRAATRRCAVTRVTQQKLERSDNSVK